MIIHVLIVRVVICRITWAQHCHLRPITIDEDRKLIVSQRPAKPGVSTGGLVKNSNTR